nr:efflux RND transporter periplasmic adaptor subunit [Pleionea sp. CnH1-48]
MIAGCEKEQPVIKKSYRPVQYVKVTNAEGEVKQTFSGVVEAGLDAQLSFRVSGTVDNRQVKLGDRVEKGQLLMSLESTDYQVAVQQAQANLQQARANERNSKANYERVTELYENNNASRSDLDGARAGAESAKATTQVAFKQLESAQLQLSYTKLKAPQACSIAQVLADTNENVAAGQGVLRINCGQCPKIKVSIPEQFIRLITTNDHVQVTSTSNPDKVYSAVISEVGVAAESGGAFPVEALLQDSCDEFRTGMTANVKFDFSQHIAKTTDSQLFVPYLSVGQDEKGNYLFVLEPFEGEVYKATKRYIQVGEKAQNGIQVVTGLKEGELIATAGVRKLLDGMEVKLLDKPILGAY